MTRQAKWGAWSLAGFVVLLLLGIGLAGEEAPPLRVPGPDYLAACEAWREDLVIYHAHFDTVQGPDVAPWSHRMPRDPTRRPQ